jgi:hypothetical protein
MNHQVWSKDMRASSRIIAISALTLAAAFAASPLAARAQTAPATTATGARPGNDIGTRDSLPLSPYASNITPGDTKSTIAPTPPEPNVGPDATVAQLLTAAEQSLATGQTGTADEALEQAETQLLTRSVLATQADAVSQDPVVTQISQARQALGSGNKAGTMQIINQILASNAPELVE